MVTTQQNRPWETSNSPMQSSGGPQTQSIEAITQAIDAVEFVRDIEELPQPVYADCIQVLSDLHLIKRNLKTGGTGFAAGSYSRFRNRNS